jgi:hypothetical protein
VRDSNAPAHAGDDTDTCELWPADCHEDMERLCDEQAAALIAELEAGKSW